MQIEKCYIRGAGLGGGIGDIISIINCQLSTINYLHYNHRGDVILTTDETGNEKSKYSYTAFGSLITDQPITDNRFIGFSSKEFDKKTGLIYFGFRYYDPELGRWLKFDPAGEGRNLYAFVENRPTKAIDIHGERSQYLGERDSMQFWDKNFSHQLRKSQFWVNMLPKISHNNLVKRTAKQYNKDEIYNKNIGVNNYLSTIKEFGGRESGRGNSDATYGTLDIDYFFDNHLSYFNFNGDAVRGDQINYFYQGVVTMQGGVPENLGLLGNTVWKLSYLSLPDDNTLFFYYYGRLFSHETVGEAGQMRCGN